MSLKRFSIAIVTLLLLFGCNNENNSKKDVNQTNSSKEHDSNTSKQKIEHNSRTFTIETISKETLHIKDLPNGFKFEEFKDKAILVVFFGYKCPPCLREIPRLNELIESHRDNLEIIAFEVQGLDDSELANFVKERDIKYKVVRGLGYMDFISYVQNRAQWQGAIPFLIALNRDGEVEFVQVGGLFKKELEYIYKEITGDKK